MNTDPGLSHCIKTNSRSVKDLSMKHKTAIKNMGITLQGIGIEKEFMNRDPFAPN